VAINCSLIGVFLVLRRMAMVGDAISHAVLTGIVIAYLVSDSRHSLVMLSGAAAFGLLATYLIEWFHRRARIQMDASIGITFTWLFSVGLILVSSYTCNIDLDQDCVLYGDITYVPFDIFIWADADLGPLAIWTQGFNLVLLLCGVLLGYRGLSLTSFDPSFASSIGVKTGAWHYGIMAAVSLTVVLSFNAVGAILVVAFMVVPASAAQLISKDLVTMLWVSAAVGVASSILGYYAAAAWNVSISGSMAVASGVILVIVFLISNLRPISQIQMLWRNRFGTDEKSSA